MRSGLIRSIGKLFRRAPQPPATEIDGDIAGAGVRVEYSPCIDGDPDPYAAWISKPYGGGTREAPRDDFRLGLHLVIGAPFLESRRRAARRQ